MSYKFQADLGWMKLQGEEDDAAKFVEFLKEVKEMPKGPLMSEQAVASGMSDMFVSEEWVWASMLDEFRLHFEQMAKDQVALMFNEFSNQMEERLRVLEIGTPTPSIEPVQDDFTARRLPGETPSEQIKRERREQPVTKGPYGPRDKTLDVEAVREDLKDASVREVAQKHGTSKSTVSYQADAHREERKAEFAALKNTPGLYISDLVEIGGLPNAAWVHNRATGGVWPKQDDLELMRAAVRLVQDVKSGKKQEVKPPAGELVQRRLRLAWEPSFRACCLMAGGRSDADVAAVIEKEFYKWGGSPPSAEDMAQVRKELEADIRTLETAIAISPGELNATKPAVSEAIKERGGVCVEYMRPKIAS